MFFFIVALRAEARPLIARFKLKALAIENAPFRLYRNDQQVLIITGIGRVAAGAGVAYLAATFNPEKTSCWLNVGVAGQRTLALGASTLAHKITSCNNDQVWYPGFTFSTSIQTVDMITVDQSSTDYPTPAVYDMEAAGFFSMAMRVAYVDLIHCYKVISDNRQQPESIVTGAGIETLLTEKLNEIEQLTNQLQVHSSRLFPLARENKMIAQLLAKHHYTVTQRHQLKRLVQRWLALKGDSDLPFPSLSVARSAKEVIRLINNQL
ncbi:MAG: 5'-methylthioadenosine/S-adenosylhomocysteine nucleosidase [Gammaproteobacteria bacterium]|nr:5'-methylthioadenosine/S-adenosylhomocysteine nucleosidase [Gammaproteobacteria bacterium]